MAGREGKAQGDTVIAVATSMCGIAAALWYNMCGSIPARERYHS
jgi:hypothetical protein